MSHIHDPVVRGYVFVCVYTSSWVFIWVCIYEFVGVYLGVYIRVRDSLRYDRV